MTRPPANYRLFSAVLAPALLGHACRRALRDGGRDYLRGRLGFIEPGPGEGPVWLHCASVGEVVTALPLLRALRDAGIGPLAVSTNTPTGHRTAVKHVFDGVRVLYLPLDRPRPVRRFLDRLRPRAALVLETELWPWLYAGLHQRAVPLFLVNARLSKRTLDAPRWWRGVAAWCLRHTRAVLARSEGDAEAFLRLGAPPGRVRTVGDLKLAAPDETPEAIALPRPYVLAASTHDDEERRLAAARRATCWSWSPGTRSAARRSRACSRPTVTAWHGAAWTSP
jgi:3-deoxy-D-manno-octulosonic-acid transferase